MNSSIPITRFIRAAKDNSVLYKAIRNNRMARITAVAVRIGFVIEGSEQMYDESIEAS